jgi:hypothetical protein
MKRETLESCLHQEAWSIEEGRCEVPESATLSLIISSGFAPWTIDEVRGLSLGEHHLSVDLDEARYHLAYESLSAIKIVKTKKSTSAGFGR